MELIYLKTFVQSVETGSFSKAADLLCVTQSAISRRIKFLEDQYGYLLLDRSGPTLVPTEAGKIVLTKARELLSIEDELKKGLQGIGQKETLSFCCTPAFGMVHLPRVVRELLQSSSDLRNISFFTQTPDLIMSGVQDGKYDVGLLEHSEPFDFEGLEVISLPEDGVMFVSAPRLGIPQGELSIDMLADYKLFMRMEECCSSLLLLNNLKNIGRDYSMFKSKVVYDDLRHIMNSVVEGLGIAFMSQSIVQELIADGKLHPHYVSGFAHTRKRHLVMKKAACRHHKVDIIIREVKRCFEGAE